MKDNYSLLTIRYSLPKAIVRLHNHTNFLGSDSLRGVPISALYIQTRYRDFAPPDFGFIDPNSISGFWEKVERRNEINLNYELRIGVLLRVLLRRKKLWMFLIASVTSVTE